MSNEICVFYTDKILFDDLVRWLTFILHKCWLIFQHCIIYLPPHCYYCIHMQNLNSPHSMCSSCGSFINYISIYLFIHSFGECGCMQHFSLIWWCLYFPEAYFFGRGDNITNHKVVAAQAVCWVHFSLPKNAARGGPIWDGWSFEIDILYDLKSPNFVFFLAILV